MLDLGGGGAASHGRVQMRDDVDRFEVSDDGRDDRRYVTRDDLSAVRHSDYYVISDESYIPDPVGDRTSEDSPIDPDSAD